MAIYIKVPGIYNKLKQSEKENRVLYISGPNGYGKTAAYEYFYRRKPYLVMDGKEGRLSEMPDMDTIRQSVVVFENIGFIVDEISQKYILNMIYNGQRNVILVSPGTLPVWLIEADVELDFIRADRRDLAFSENETLEFFQKKNISITADMSKMITKRINGFPLLLTLYVKYMGEQAEFNEELIKLAERELYHYIDRSLWDWLTEEFIEALLVCCEFDSFTVEMVEEIAGINRMPDLLEYSYSIGHLIRRLDEGHYKINDEFREYVKWKRAFVYNKEDFLNLYTRTASYYEKKVNLVQAFLYLDKAGMYERISQLLIENADYGPGRIQIYHNRKYILSLPEEKIKNNTVLMSCTALVYSLMMRPDESEKWCCYLQQYATDPSRTEEEYKDAKRRLVYLDIYLMHRHTDERIQGIMTAADMLQKDKVGIPTLAFTANAPSLLNGGWDLSKWIKENQWRTSALIKPLRFLYGKFSQALITIGTAEAMFEQNASDSYELMVRLNKGYAMADSAGELEICFVAMVLMARQRITRGRIAAALDLCDNFRKKMQKEEADFLLPNLNAFLAWISLLQGNVLDAGEWLKKSSNETEEFSVMNRYQYIHKMRVYMVQGKMEQASSLAQRLNVHFTNYNREYYWIQIRTLFAIILYRSDDNRWEEILIEALKKAEEYHYVRVIADEGVAVQPLLKKIKKAFPRSAFYNEVMDAVDKMAKLYPDYLEVMNRMEEPLTKKEKEILKLMASGKTSEEICSICDISYSGLKFHNRNIYRKLGVSNRQEAERKATLLRVVD